jgi:Tfp pilus assembly protein PilO
MWILLLLLVVAGLWASRREPMTVSASDMVQKQSGDLQQLHDKLTSLQMNEASIEALQDENDQMSDQLNQLQANLPSDEVANAYP